MADVTLLNVNYQDVPIVELPKTGGGTASFVDVTDTSANASDVAYGKVFYNANGTRTVGTSKQILTGSATGTIKATGTTINQVQFPQTMQSAPVVMLTFGGYPGDNAGAADLFGKMQLYVSDTTTTGFTYRLVNASTNGAISSTTVYWIAIA